MNLSSGYGGLRYLSDHYRNILSPEGDAAFANEPTETKFREKVQFSADDAHMQKEYAAAYKISKACLNAWTRMVAAKLRKELPKESEDILINAADPGYYLFIYLF